MLRSLLVCGLLLSFSLPPGAQIGTVRTQVRISATSGGFGGLLDPFDRFGTGLTRLRDLDGDGIDELAVGAAFDDDGGTDRGAVWILFRNADGSVREERKISLTAGGFPGPLGGDSRFGGSLADMGDLDGDGVTDLAVGASDDDLDGIDRGSVFVLLLNADGTVKHSVRIADGQGGFGDLAAQEQFGSCVANVGDLDGDGRAELLVGARKRSILLRYGAVWILFLEADGTVRERQEIGRSLGGGPPLDLDDRFGWSAAGLGDLDGDGVPDAVVAAPFDDDGQLNAGALWILFLQADGRARAFQKISATAGGFGGLLAAEGRLGQSLACLGDLNGDGVPDLAVGLGRDDAGGSNQGAFWTLFLNADGSVRTQAKVSAVQGGFQGPLMPGDRFGNALAALGDDDGDGFPDVVVAAPFAADGATEAGAVWRLSMEGDTRAPQLSCANLDRGVLVVSATSGAGAIVDYEVLVSDDNDPAPTLVCFPPPGSQFPVGVKRVVCAATDRSGNRATCTFLVSVQPAGPGFLADGR